MAALVFPTPAQAAAQTPLNTFSPTSTPLVNTSNTFTYVYNTTLGLWTGGAGGGGGGGGTVTGVTGTLPITVATGTTTPLIGINAATTAATGSIQLATAAENAAGTDATKAVTPAFSVPKDASGMTGAGILPSGTTAQQPGTLVTGMIRYNTDLKYEEIYTGATLGWRSLAWVPIPQTLPANLTISASGTYSGFYYVNDLTINVGVTVTSGSQDLTFICTGNVVINGAINATGDGPKGGDGAFANSNSPYNQTGAGPFGGVGVGPSAGNIYTPLASVLGSGGTGGFAAVNGFQASYSQITSGAGGAAGGTVLLRSYKNITVSATGSITANGANGTGAGGPGGNGDYLTSGPGGGSGGCIVLNSDGNLTMAGSLTANGGNGGSPACSGNYNAWGNTRGGAGGGGGYIILQTPETLTVTGTTSVAGGLPDLTSQGTGTNYFAGAQGGSFGGKGGVGNGNADSTAGGTGVVTYVGSPFN